MKTIKERAKAIYLQWAESTEFDSSGANAYAMGCLLQELIDAPEPEPVAHAILLPNGATRIWFSDRDSGELWRSRERVEQELTPLYTAPPAKNQSEQHLEMVNPPAPSVPDEFYNAVANLSVELEELVAETSGVYGLHLNGDPSPWEEILEGGRFERISSLHVVQNLLATRQPKQPEQQEQPADLVRDAERHLACNGSNCGCTDGISHSDECILGHDAIVNEAALADHVEHGGWKCFGCGYDGQDNQRYNRICARCGVHR